MNQAGRQAGGKGGCQEQERETGEDKGGTWFSK